jgi:DNA (cytosine-5)-methyltransferase 1
VSPDISVVDLFCGAGGLTCGLEKADLNVEVGVDVEDDCEYPYERNNQARFESRDLATVAREDPDWVAELFDQSADYWVLAGCPPCQPFSSLTHGEESDDHEMSGLVEAFGSLVEDVEPDIVVMENVSGVKHAEGYRTLERRLTDAGYNFNLDSDRRVFCPEWAIPQSRRRWVTLASRDGLLDLGEPPIDDEDEYSTVSDAIGTENGFPKLDAGEVDDDDRLHQARKLSELNRERIEHSIPGGTWEDWPEHLILDCHAKDSGQSYSSVYGRMDPDKPAPTITTQFYNLGSGRFGHYDLDQNRALSLREGAVLQTFPRDYEFVPADEEVRFDTVGRWIGNAVPPKLGEHIGERIRQFLTGEDRQAAITDYPA